MTQGLYHNQLLQLEIMIIKHSSQYKKLMSTIIVNMILENRLSKPNQTQKI